MDVDVKTWKVKFFQAKRGDYPVNEFIIKQDITMRANNSFNQTVD